MHRDEDFRLEGTMADSLVQKLSDEESGQEFAREYLKADFLAAAVDALFYARRQAGLTQAQVAERLHTKQAAIARLEADTEGSMSLRRYVEFALACGMIPLEMVFAPVDAVRNYVMENPEAPWTQEAYNTWIKTSSQALSLFAGDSLQLTGSTVQSTINVAQSATTLQGVGPMLNVVEVQPQALQVRFGESATIAQSESQNQALTLAQPVNRHYEKAA
jgi:transcriptional regulator with XRE-family HTH domain